MNFKKVLAGACAGAMVLSTMCYSTMATDIGTAGNWAEGTLITNSDIPSDVDLSKLSSVVFNANCSGLNSGYDNGNFHTNSDAGWQQVSFGGENADNPDVTITEIGEFSIELPVNYTGWWFQIGWGTWQETQVYSIQSVDFYAGEDLIGTWTDGSWCSHSNTELVSVVTANCLQEGYTGDTKCTDCGKVLATGSAIEKTDHDAGALDATTVKAATCTEEGYTGDTKCTVCNTVVKAGSKTDKIAHTPATDATTAKDATCTADGKEADVICTVCGETITAGAAIPATGHSYGEDGYCTKCGKLNPELCAHDGDTEIANAADATCTEAGYTGDTVCSICDEVLEKGEAILAKGHDEGKLDETTVKAATCTEAGYTGDVKCTVCGEVVTAGTEIAATGHTYVDGVCSVCGEKDPSVAATEETEAPEEAGATEASEEAGATEASEEAGATEATEVESPETGDHASVAALAVAVVSAMGIALVASKKKFNA